MKVSKIYTVNPSAKSKQQYIRYTVIVDGKRKSFHNLDDAERYHKRMQKKHGEYFNIPTLQKLSESDLWNNHFDIPEDFIYLPNKTQNNE